MKIKGERMKHVEIVAAIIEEGGLILCTQRKESPYPYISFKWEFPGGKIEEKESQEEALIREIKEELQAQIESQSFFMSTTYDYPDFKLTMHLYKVKLKNSKIDLQVHLDHCWLAPQELSTLDWAAADIAVVNVLQQE